MVKQRKASNKRVRPLPPSSPRSIAPSSGVYSFISGAKMCSPCHESVACRGVTQVQPKTEVSKRLPSFPLNTILIGFKLPKLAPPVTWKNEFFPSVKERGWRKKRKKSCSQRRPSFISNFSIHNFTDQPTSTRHAVLYLRNQSKTFDFPQ